uniref:Integrase catalytic domain-containing protein n=1 Tax=Amphimedon queenslandica TaxID=400682 RepID=A0A1X7V7V7_AMPQE
MVLKHIRSTPYHLGPNGMAERFVQSFKTALKAAESNGLPICNQLANMLLAYKSTPHSTTNESLALLFFKRQLETRLDMIHPDISSDVQNSQTCQKEYYDCHARFREVVPELDEFAPEPDSHWSIPPVENPTVPQDPQLVQEPHYPSRNCHLPNRFGWVL